MAQTWVETGKLVGIAGICLGSLRWLIPSPDPWGSRGSLSTVKTTMGEEIYLRPLTARGKAPQEVTTRTSLWLDTNGKLLDRLLDRGARCPFSMPSCPLLPEADQASATALLPPSYLKALAHLLVTSICISFILLPFSYLACILLSSWALTRTGWPQVDPHRTCSHHLPPPWRGRGDGWKRQTPSDQDKSFSSTSLPLSLPPSSHLMVPLCQDRLLVGNLSRQSCLG